jgi:hypothetical protein
VSIALSSEFASKSKFCLLRVVLPEGIWFKVKGFGEADAFPSGDAEARRIWAKFTRPFGFPAGGQPLCQAASDDGNTSTSPPSAWIVSPSGKQNWL